MIRALLFLAVTAAHADFPPSVWEQMEHNSPSVFTQMQEGRTNTIETNVKDVELRQGAVYLTVDKGQTHKLCKDDLDRASSEAERAMHLNQRVQSLRDAKKSKESVRLRQQGPWSPCVAPTNI